MSFIRTASGLSNLYLFFNVSAVVFVEGGKRSHTLSEVLNGEYESVSSDIMFWRGLFEYFRGSERFQFRSVGSKTVLIAIANILKNQSITNVIVAMDCDHDRINKNIIYSPNVIYTLGYSWENDVWCNFIVYKTFQSIVGACDTFADEIKNDIYCKMTEFFSKINKYVGIDILASQYSLSYFDRSSYHKYLRLDSKKCPSVNVNQAKNSIAILRNKIGRKIYKKHSYDFDPQCNCFGKIISEYGYRLLMYFVNKHGKKQNLSKEYASSLVNAMFMMNISNHDLEKIRTYYNDWFSNLIVIR